MLADFTNINHPVHIINKDNQMSPSAFIPFCDFGGNMSAVGTKIDKFDAPVCSCFQAIILIDQLCYEVDLNLFTSKDTLDKDIDLGFNFFMDYNEDKQVTFQHVENNRVNLVNSIVKVDMSHHAFIYLDTIGKQNCGTGSRLLIIHFQNQLS